LSTFGRDKDEFERFKGQLRTRRIRKGKESERKVVGGLPDSSYL